MGRAVHPHIITDDSALGGSVIERSLRFDRNDNAYLSRTPSSAGNRKTFTYSAWVKLGQTGVNSSNDPGNGLFLSCGSAGTGLNMALRITNNGYIGIDYYGVGGYYSTGRLRDSNAWYHCVWVMDTTESTSGNRMKVYVNGDLFYNNSMSLSQNADTPINNNSLTTIGVYPYNTSHAYRLDAYLTEVHFVDGQALTPSSFGYTESQTGLWRPKRYEGTYGTNGFHLEFKDNSSTSALGKDTSGNGNDFTPNNLATTDAVKDSPTNNFCTFNPLSKDNGTALSEGNLKIISANFGNNTGTFFLTSGKWYWEGLGSGYVVAICGNAGQNFATSLSGSGSNSIGYWVGGNAYWDGGNSGSGTSYSSTDIIAAALDMDNGTIKFYKNNTLAHDLTFGSGTIPDLSAGVFPVYNNGGGSSRTVNFNFGQDSSFAGNKTAQGNTDGNGKGDFYYAPPSGYLAICSANLPPNVPSIIRPQKHFETVTYSGTGSTNKIESLEFAPDLVWVKRRNSTSYHIWSDTVRGAGNYLVSNTTDAESSGGSQLINGFLKDGFQVGTENAVNNGSGTYVAWCWKAGGTAVTNNDGSKSVTLSANQEAGFSIIEFAGNAANATIGHGLGKKPKWFIVKSRTHSQNWFVYHVSTGATKNPRLNDSAAAYTTANIWNNTEPTDTVINLGSSSGVNGNGNSYICYCWTDIPGYSKFGSYTGNGSSDGTYVHLGFKPAWILVKRSSASENWALWDNKRDGGVNPNGYLLRPDSTNDEGGNVTGHQIDLLSNGFKLRFTDSKGNGNGSTYIYMAFAEQPGTTPYDTQTNAR